MNFIISPVCDTAYPGRSLPMFRRILMPSSSGFNNKSINQQSFFALPGRLTYWVDLKGF
jgi:hypothetical protein